MAGNGIVVDINAKIDGFEAEIKKTNALLNKFQRDARSHSGSVAKSIKTIEDSFGGLKNIAFSFAGGFGFAEVTKDIIDTNRQMESLRAQLKAIEGSSRGAERTFKFISDFATNTPFEINGLTETYIKLQNFGINPTTEVMQALTNQASKLGGSQETLSGITLALGQAYSKGKLQAEEMNQLIERGVPVYELLAQVTGKNSSELQEMSKNGELTRDVLDKLIVKMGELANGSNAAAMDTLNGKISNLSDAWHKFQDTLLNDKSEGIIKTLVTGATISINAITDSIDGSLEGQLKRAQEKLVDLETFRARSTTGFRGNEITDQRIKEQGDIIDALKRKKALQDAADAEVDIKKKTAEAIKQTNQYIYDIEAEDAEKLEKLKHKKGSKKEPEILFDNSQLEKSEKIIARLRQELQLTREQAAGVVGNLFHESAGLKTGAKSKDGFGSIGLAQWTFDRKKQLEEFSKGLGKPVADFDTQIDFLIKELKGKESNSLSRLKNTSNVADAAVAFQSSFERPNKDVAHTDRRIAAANASYLGGLTKSEVDNTEKAIEEATKKAEEHKEKVAKILSEISQDITNSKLPEVQRKINDEIASSLESLGLAGDKLSKTQQQEKRAIIESIETKYKLIEANDRLAKQQQANVDVANFRDQILDETHAIEEGLVTREQYIEQLTKLSELHDLFKAGDITFGLNAAEFKKETDALSEEFNKTANVAKEATDQMSEFAKESARNMQDAFAEFLFDPFKGGVEGMLDNFATAMRRLAANALANNLVEALLGKNGAGGLLGGLFGGGVSSSSGGGFIDLIGSIIGGLASFDVGTPRVPRTGLALIHKDEAIIPAKYNKQGVSPYGHNSYDNHNSNVVNINQTINVGSGSDAAQVRRAAGAGARDALALLNGSQRYR